MRKKDLTAIKMRFEGKSSLEIGQVLRCSAGTVDNWFSAKGRLQNEYRNFSVNAIRLIAEESIDDLVKNSQKSANVFVGLLESGNDYIRMKAAKEILDRAVGEPKKPMEVKGKISIVDLLKEIENQKEEREE